VGLETVRERRACVSGNCERSTRVYTVDDEDIRLSGLVQVNDGLYAEVPCKRTDSPTMDCPDVCLEAFWPQELQWMIEDTHKRSRWKNSIGVGMSVPRPCGSNVYVCSNIKKCFKEIAFKIVDWIYLIISYSPVVRENIRQNLLSELFVFKCIRNKLYCKKPNRDVHLRSPLSVYLPANYLRIGLYWVRRRSSKHWSLHWYKR
jgi:hypothetical protein